MSRLLKLCLPTRDVWNPEKEVFDIIGGDEIELEHSLYTLAGWEAKWKTQFAKKEGLTHKQLLDYIMNFMCQTPDVPRTAWLTLDNETLEKIQKYMEDPQSGTTIKSPTSGKLTNKRETVSAELLYCYMFQLGIPMECERWHLNRLMTLIDVCAIKSTPPKKMSRKEAALLQQQQNAAMRKKLGSKG